MSPYQRREVTQDDVEMNMEDDWYGEFGDGSVACI